MCIWWGAKNGKMKNYLVWVKKKKMIENNICLNLLSYPYYIFKKNKFFIREKNWTKCWGRTGQISKLTSKQFFLSNLGEKTPQNSGPKYFVFNPSISPLPTEKYIMLGVYESSSSQLVGPTQLSDRQRRISTRLEREGVVNEGVRLENMLLLLQWGWVLPVLVCSLVGPWDGCFHLFKLILYYGCQ